VESYESIATATEDKIFTESLNSSFEDPDLEIEMGDPINPIRVNKEALEKQLPRLMRARDIVHDAAAAELEEESDLEEYKKLKTPPKQPRRGESAAQLPSQGTVPLVKGAVRSSRMEQEEIRMNLDDIIEKDDGGVDES
jgi:hypothetical protein